MPDSVSIQFGKALAKGVSSDIVVALIDSSMLEKPVQVQFRASSSRIHRTVRAGRWSGESTVPTMSTLNADHNTWDEATTRTSAVEYQPSTATLRVVDLFSGCGGLAYGVRDAAKAVGLAPSFEAAADIDLPALQIYRTNLSPKRILQTNVWESLDFQVHGRGVGASLHDRPVVLLAEMASMQNNVDLLIGGPPCQGHSTANNRTRLEDPRNILYLAMPAAAVALNIPAIIIENVPNIRNAREQVVQTAQAILQNEGYNVVEEVVDCLRIGLPQTRKRHILVAVKGGQPSIQAVLDELNTQTRTVDWAIRDLLDIPESTTFDTPASLSEVNRQRIQHLFAADAYEMPNAIRPPSHVNGHTYPAVYGRLRWDRPSGTITSGFHTPGRGRFIHPSRQRALTAHEAARLQGFPDSFQFRFLDGTYASRTVLARSIGDAVPPKLGYAATLAALSALEPSLLVQNSSRYTYPDTLHRPLRTRRRR